jgi:hypothetical protein
MKDMNLHPLPTSGAVLKEQIRTVGLALRPLGIGVGILLVIFGVYGLYDNLVEPNAMVGLPPDLLMYLSFIGIALPLFVRRGSVTPFRPGLPWTLPVDRARHALIRVGGGWFWLMVAVAVLLLWAVGIPLLSGGAIEEPQLHLVAPFTDPRPLDPASLPTVLWSIPWWLWLVPFPAATAVYLFTSALLLATPHPARWIVGAVLGTLLLGYAADWINLMWLLDPLAYVLNHIVDGQYGLSTLVTGATSAVASVDLPTGESMPMFVGVPTFGRWVLCAALWIGIGLGFLGLASLRHRDGAARPGGGD